VNHRRWFTVLSSHARVPKEAARSRRAKPVMLRIIFFRPESPVAPGAAFTALVLVV
jgi:hypothetical protein